jgi:hypothetical protein
MPGTTKELRELIERAANWPADAQDDLIRAGREIESGQFGSYQATPEELQAIDDAELSGVASEDEVAAALAKFRRG